MQEFYSMFEERDMVIGEILDFEEKRAGGK
jgi:hypothetical protein